MNRDDVLRMAMDAGISPPKEVHEFWICEPSDIERFAALVTAHEREACANVCEETTAAWTQHLYNSGCMDCAAAIRARGES